MHAYVCNIICMQFSARRCWIFLVRLRWVASSLVIPVLNLWHVTCGIPHPKTMDIAHHLKDHMHIGVVIKHARESECRSFVSVAKDKPLCSWARAISSRVVDYFAWLKMRSEGRGPLKRASKATSWWLWWIKTLAFLKSTKYVKDLGTRHSSIQ